MAGERYLRDKAQFRVCLAPLSLSLPTESFLITLLGSPLAPTTLPVHSRPQVKTTAQRSPTPTPRNRMGLEQLFFYKDSLAVFNQDCQILI